MTDERDHSAGGAYPSGATQWSPGAESGPGSEPVAQAAAPTATLSPAAWHPDPEHPGYLRWWDGQAWTEHRTPSQAQPAPADKRRFRPAIVIGVIAVVLVALFVLAGVLRVLAAATEPSPLGEVAFEIAEPVPDSWATASTLNGAGSVAYDPAWEDATDVLKLTMVTEEANAESGLTMINDGAWITGGDYLNGAETIIVTSLDVEGDPAGVRDFAEGTLETRALQFDSLVRTEEGVFATPSGQEGYLIRFVATLAGLELDGAVGVVSSPAGFTAVQYTGGEHIEPGQADFDAMIASLVLR